MSTNINVGILGIGVYLPEQVRTNDWWPEAVVEKWQDKITRNLGRMHQQPDETLTDGARCAVQAMAAYAHDPFHGSVERRIMPDGLRPSDMETLAARAALQDAGLLARDVDLILGYSIVPDYLTSPNVCLVHKNLGLLATCTAFGVEAACNSFALQLSIARAMIVSGQARSALLFQSNNLRNLIPIEEPHSAWFGDGATAVVVGHVSAGKGILSIEHRTDGATHAAMVSGVPGQRWFDDGKVCWYAQDRAAGRMMLLAAPDRAREVVGAALDVAQVNASRVDFFACHQPLPWFRSTIQEFCDIRNARSVDTFKWAGSLSAANIPLVLATGAREGLLRAGDVAATFSGGSGETWSSVVMRWGR